MPLARSSDLSMNRRSSSVLIVSDDLAGCQMLSRYLTREGLQVSIAADPEQALGLISKNTFDLVVLDVEATALSGLEVLRTIRKTYSLTDLPVVVIGGLDHENIVKVLDAGANDYISKPFDFAAARVRIEAQLSLKHTQTALREIEERFTLTARGANDGLWDWNLKTNEVYFSPRWKSMLGFEEDEISNQLDEWLRRIHPEDVDQFKKGMSAHLEGTTPHFEHEYRMRHRDGYYLCMLARGLAFREDQGKAYRLAGSQSNVTQGRLADVLTGLPNRLMLMDRLGYMMRRSQRHKSESFAVIYLDLDDFKLINDSYGRAVGDQLLVAVAGRLVGCMRSEDTVSRMGASHDAPKDDLLAHLGGDEFAILLTGITDPSDASRVAERIQNRLSKPLSIGGNEVFATACMGIASSITGYDSPDEVLRDAGTALHRAKAQGKACSEIFDAGMRAVTLARLQLETELRRAFDDAQFQYYYQPLVELDTGRILGFEALTHWSHPRRGLIGPSEFIPLAEKTGLIVRLDQQVLRQACNQMRSWHAEYPTNPPMIVSANLSAKHFMRADLVEDIVLILQETGFAPRNLNLEVTESTVISDPNAAIAKMASLKSLGVQLSLDDFGTGYSSLTYLHRFPVDALKVDRSFVSRITQAEEGMEMVRTIVTLAHNLGKAVVAEGIETVEQLALLRSLGVEYGQGFHFSKPLTAESASDFLSNRT